MKILIKNGKIINYDKIIYADILIENDKIKKINNSIDIKTDKTIDAKGKYIIPGGVDVHTHLDMPFGGTTSSDDFKTGTIAAALGGTTSIIDFAIQSKNYTLHQTIDTWMKKAHNKSVIDYGFHCILKTFNEKIQEEMSMLVNEGITSFKLFTAYPKVFMMDDGNIFKVMQHAGKIGASVSIHAENGHIIEVLTEQAIKQGKTSPKYHAITRPPQTEAEAIHRVITIADIAEVPVYIVHLSSSEGLDEIKYAKYKNKIVFAETCPQYLLLSDKCYNEPKFHGAKYVMSPPLRNVARQEELWNGLNQNYIHTIATDHCPFFFKKQKELGLNNFTKIPNGIPSIETRISLIYHYGVLTQKISLTKWIDLIATQPAKLFGLYPKKGIIKINADADIVLFNPNKKHILNHNNLHMNTDYSPYQGSQITGTIDTVIMRGKIIVKNQQFIGALGYGKFLKRNKNSMHLLS